MPPKKKFKVMNPGKPIMISKAPTQKKKKKLIVTPPKSNRFSVPEFMPKDFTNVLTDRKKYQKKTADKWKKEIARLKEKLKTGGLGGTPAVDGARFNINFGIKEATKQLEYIKSTKYLELLKKRRNEFN
tara:strand:+ start:306 stop:692 length:387 start_codon:yes stop_codon:yes gene_type:complete